MKCDKKTLFGVIMIALGAFFLRFYNIDILPPGIYPDEAVNGQDALRVLDGAHWQWFYTDNQGREGLFINLVAICFAVFGVSAMSLKLPAIICGTLTVVGTFFLSRELFRSDRVALIAAIFNAVAFTAINFSRISFRANMLPLVLVWSFYFLYRGFHNKKYHDFIFAGMIFGVGMHTYIAFRIAPLILILLVPCLIGARMQFIRLYWRHLCIFIMSFVIVAAPMFYTFFVHPEYFNSRSEHVSVFSPEVNHGHPWTVLSKSVWLAMAKYTFVGDMNWRNNYPPYPLLDPIMALFFLGGVFLVLKRGYLAMRKHIQGGAFGDDLIIYPFLILWFIILLAPEFLTYESNPHALRSIGVLPVVYIIAALCMSSMWEFMLRRFAVRKNIMTYFFFFLIVIVIGFNSIKYFGLWARNPLTSIYFEKDITQLAYAIQDVSEEKEVVVILGNMQRVPVRMFNWGRDKYMDINPFELQKIMPKDPQETVFFFSNFHKEEIMMYLMSAYPDLQYSEVVNDAGQKYYILQ